MQVCFGVDADGVVLGGLNVEGEAILQEAELFQTLAALKSTGG